MKALCKSDETSTSAKPDLSTSSLGKLQESPSSPSSMNNFGKKSAVTTSKSDSIIVKAEDQKEVKEVKETQKVFEEEDSLHGATTDLGGTTIPA